MKEEAHRIHQEAGRRPMKMAVISDIHGNLEAFDSVLTDIRKQRVNMIVSLGDNIGYGADSEAVIRALRKHHIRSIMGNHELAAIDTKAMAWFKADARKAVLQAVASLSEESKRYLHDLKMNLSLADCLFVHGFPPDSARFYLFQISDARLRKAFEALRESVCFIGHTHKLSLVYREDHHIHSHELSPGTTFLEKGRKYIINAGSVGQPRDGDPGAKYIIWDATHRRLDVRSVPYDVRTAARKIVTAGIPIQFARRLDSRIS